MSEIELERVSRHFGERDVVHEVSLSIAAGETFVLIGPSGCGKTTTLKMINRLVEPTSGMLRVRGTDVRTMDAAELRRGIGYVIQDVGLFAHYTARDNVAIVPRLLGWSESKVRARVDELLAVVGLPDAKFGARYPRELSGGQRQRVGIARALAADPPIVLLDEPFGALDPITREHLQDEFLALSTKLGKTFVLVTHDIFEAVRLADRIAVMRDGQLVQCAAPADLVRKPADEFVSSLLGRHRYQLLLMTTTVGEALAAGIASRAEAPTERASDVAADASVWSALEKMASEHAAWVRSEARYASREQLVSAVGA